MWTDQAERLDDAKQRLAESLAFFSGLERWGRKQFGQVIEERADQAGRFSQPHFVDELHQLPDPKGRQAALQGPYQHRVRYVGLELSTLSPQHAQASPVSILSHGAQQAGLPDPRLALHQHHSPSPGQGVLHPSQEGGPLVGAAHQRSRGGSL